MINEQSKGERVLATSKMTCVSLLSYIFHKYLVVHLDQCVALKGGQCTQLQFVLVYCVEDRNESTGAHGWCSSFWSQPMFAFGNMYLAQYDMRQSRCFVCILIYTGL